MPTPPRSVEPGFGSLRPRLRRPSWRAAASLAVLAAAPKCFLCLAGWLGLGAALGLGGPEICGRFPGARSPENLALILGAASAIFASACAAIHAFGRERKTREAGPASLSLD